MQEYRETSRALKRKENIGLKLGLKKRGDTKVFANLSFTIFFL